MPSPDFVIAGAPRCGTTSLFAMLDGHPGVYMSSLKEPHYFSTDRYRLIRHRFLYDWLFALADRKQLRGEASTSYISSIDAMPALLKANPNVKIIAIARNPADMYISWHNECLRAQDEDQEDPELAWRLPPSRPIPKFCKDRVVLDYRFICSIGTQLTRLKALVPPRNLLLLLLDDLKTDAAATYLQVLAFLGIADDGRRSFPVENQFARFSNDWSAGYRRAAEVWPPIVVARALLRPLLKWANVDVARFVPTHAATPVPKPKVSDGFRQELWTVFEPEVGKLEALLNRSLQHWAPPSRLPAASTR